MFRTRINNSSLEVDLESDLEILQGKVNVYQTDEKGNIWLTEELYKDAFPYILEYKTAENDVIADYMAGLPGFGGSDTTLSVKIEDIVPPVIQCTLIRGKETEDPRFQIGKEITATDNVDGDLTAKITYETQTTDNSRGHNDSLEYGLVVVYSVADSSGNVSELTVTYDVREIIEGGCGAKLWVVSVKR